MSARIYQRPKNAMQSGKARTDEWVLEFEQSEARHADPLMGWTGSGDTQAQVQLTFPSKEEAKAMPKNTPPPASTPPAQEPQAASLRRQFPVVDFSGKRRHMARRESGGRLRSLTGSGPEGSSPGGLRRVGRLLLPPQFVGLAA